MKNLPIIEIYPCVQGEGRYAGVPHILIRLTGCKLRCQFSGSFCDTHYASWNPEKGKFTYEQIQELYEQNPQIKHTMVTGGGPTLHGDFLKELCLLIKSYDHHITIETEGSEFVDTVADCISLSPKLSNSTPRVGSIKPWNGQVVTQIEVERHEMWRQNYSAMRQLIDYHFEFQVKPVISNMSEVRELMRELDLIPSDIYLMPEGITDEQLQKNRQWLIELCIKEGFNYTDRLHVIAYGDRRGV